MELDGALAVGVAYPALERAELLQSAPGRIEHGVMRVALTRRVLRHADHDAEIERLLMGVGHGLGRC